MRELFIVDQSDNEHWDASALCAQTDPETFFPVKGESNRAAKKVCQACEVRIDCEEDIFVRGPIHGIKAGLTLGEQKKLLKSRAS